MNNKSLLFLLLLSLFFASCRKPLVYSDRPSETAARSASPSFEVHNFDFKYLTSKAKVEYADREKSLGANAVIKIAKDSAIWVSLNAIFGIEAVRCLITRDSVFYINKLDKSFEKYDFASLSKKINFDVNYKLLENLLIGNLIYPRSPQDTVAREQERDVLLQKKKNVTVSTYTGALKKVNKTVLLQGDTGNSLSAEYDDFAALSDALFPMHTVLSLLYRGKNKDITTLIRIEHKKTELFDKAPTFPFKVPDRYDNKR